MEVCPGEEQAGDEAGTLDQRREDAQKVTPAPRQARGEVSDDDEGDDDDDANRVGAGAAA